MTDELHHSTSSEEESDLSDRDPEDTQEERARILWSEDPRPSLATKAQVIYPSRKSQYDPRSPNSQAGSIGPPPPPPPPGQKSPFGPGPFARGPPPPSGQTDTGPPPPPPPGEPSRGGYFDLPLLKSTGSLNKGVQNITISDDRSIGSEFELNNRILQVLKPRQVLSGPARLSINSDLEEKTHAIEEIIYPGDRVHSPRQTESNIEFYPVHKSAVSPESFSLSSSYSSADDGLRHPQPPPPPPPPPLTSFDMEDQDHQMQSVFRDQQKQEYTPMGRDTRDSLVISSPDPLPLMSSSRSFPNTSSSHLTGAHRMSEAVRSDEISHHIPAVEVESRTVISSSIIPVLTPERNAQDFQPQPPGDSGAHNHGDNGSSTLEQRPGILSPAEAISLGVPDLSGQSFDGLRDYIQDLKKKAGALVPSKYQIIHRIFIKDEPALYFDKPQWFKGEKNSMALKSSLPISSARMFLDRNPDISFIVYRDYDIDTMKYQRSRGESDMEPQVHHTEESIFTSARDLTSCVSDFLKLQPSFPDAYAFFNESHMLDAPYFEFYHRRHVLEATLKRLNDKQRRQLRLLLDYILSQYAEDYKNVDSLLEQGKITARYIKYLFKPGDILIEGRGDDARGILATSWLELAPKPRQPKKSMDGKRMMRWQAEASAWKFNGVFSRVNEKAYLDIDIKGSLAIDVQSLHLRPLRFVEIDLNERLKRRGEMFWKCRDRHFVSHHEDKGRESHHSGDERYMIDLKTYSKLHPPDPTKSSYGKEEYMDDLGTEAMERDTPPDANFVYLVPIKIKAYNLKLKKWVDLRVDRLSEVVWNKEAFKSLVLDNKTKNLIQALISNQLEAEHSTDLISGKGNGLILLLHGGPGTGKTLTAESVAEIAEKPLYPVSCGDIETEAEKVEIYLESVLNLGKTWGCVVLLDEADVFLEQRSLADLQRNALVSVFLRVLEYYDGILVLTSNRVGTFDEAFKSRIQLALHYANLSAYQREKIWRNFFDRLRKLNVEKVDFDDLEDHLEHLSKIKMNGRQIRNAITTARQYAKWKGATLDYPMLKDIVETSGRFDVYLEKLNGGYSQDQLAEDEGVRLAETAESNLQ